MKKLVFFITVLFLSTTVFSQSLSTSKAKSTTVKAKSTTVKAKSSSSSHNAVANAKTVTNGPKITFKNTVHNYGNIYVGSDGKCEFEFTNTGNEPLILNKPKSSCGCTVPTWPREPILPGESNKIVVTYNTHHPGSFNKTVTIYSNAVNNKNVVLRIHGKVISKPKEELPVKSSSGKAPVNTPSKKK